MPISAIARPDNLNSVGILGYLIISNKQIHNYQLMVLDEYLSSINIVSTETILHDILNGTSDSNLLNTSLNAYKCENKIVQTDLLLLLYVLSYIDGVFDCNEEELIRHILKYVNITASENNVIHNEAKNIAENYRLEHNILFFSPKNNKKDHLLTKLKRLIFHNTNSNITDNDYMNSIEKCAEIANEDFSIVKPIYEEILYKCGNTIREIKDYKTELSYEEDLAAEVAKTIGSFADKLNSDVYAQTESAKQALEQKSRTVSNFTISLLGRTKAGKSTLHAILTNQGNEYIGIGMQRTTRYNRVYQWNLIRLIDTPGIGSAEADGRSDEEIAKSVLGESDIICFLVVDDSIQQDILDFIEKISKLNKPIIILLNHKENIRPDVKFKQFLKKPTEWLKTKGEARLQGHIDRIQKYADSKGFGNLIKVFPVFLLAALMSKEEKYSEYKTILWNSSNIDDFINQLKAWISISGTIKRSQTMIDEAVMSFSNSLSNIEEADKILIELNQNLESKSQRQISTLERKKDEALKNTKFALQGIYTELATNFAWEFAEEECDKKKPDVTRDWKEYLQRIEFEEAIKDAIMMHTKEYQDKAQEITIEMFEDVDYAVRNSFSSINVELPLNINMRAITRIFGDLISLGGAICFFIMGLNPIGWGVAIVGALVRLLSSVFKSKDKKRIEKRDSVYNAINKAIIDSMDDNINSIMIALDDYLTDSENSISTRSIGQLFSNLSNGIKMITGISTELKRYYYQRIHWLNKVYAWRILQFITKSTEQYSEATVNRYVKEVDRSVPGVITIYTPLTSLKGKYTFDGVITETIKIIKR